MNNEHDNRPNPLNQHQPQTSPSFLFYSTLCIVCILVSFRHIKALRSRHRRGVHCKSLPPERQTMASSPDQKAGGEPGQLEKGQPVSDSAIHHRHPSACDILQPLSHLVPVPASGHVAAAVAAGAAERQRASTTASPSARSDLSLDLPPSPRQDNQQPSRMDADPNSAGPGPGAGAGAIDHHRPHSCHPVENPSSTNPPTSSDSSHHVHNPAGPVPYPVPAVGTSGPGVAVHSSLPAEAFCRPIQPQQNPIPGPGPGPAENVAKRTETVQFCRDVDAEGIRSWRRLIVEYG